MDRDGTSVRTRDIPSSELRGVGTTMAWSGGMGTYSGYERSGGR